VAAGDPNIETEVKIHVSGSTADARAKIEAAGYSLIEDRTLESDQVYDRGEGELRQTDQLLRLRRFGNRATVTYKGPGRRERHKSREEIEFDVSDPVNFENVLERLGYSLRFKYQKYRTKFQKSGEPGIITLDETPIGIYMELEGPAQWIDATAAKLGLPESQYITQSYAAIYAEYRRSHADAAVDMTFDA
jgi:adenylate cyclase class 2